MIKTYGKIVGWVCLFSSCSEVSFSQSGLASTALTAEQLLDKLVRVVVVRKRGYQAYRSLNPLRHSRLYAEALRELAVYLRRQRNSFYRRNIYADYLETTIFFATSAGQRKVLALLKEAGGDVLEQNCGGETLLYVASLKGHSAIVEDLLCWGAAVNVSTCCGETPLHAAAMRGHLDIVRILIASQAGLEAQDTLLMTPLHRAAAHGYVEVVRALIEAGAILDVYNTIGMTPLHGASNFDQLQVVRYLIGKGAHINARSSLGFTPLACAAKRGHLKIVKFLVESNAELERPNLEGFLPITSAAIWRQFHIVDYFISIDVIIDENQKAILQQFYPGSKRKLMERRLCITEEINGATDELFPVDIIHLIVSFCCLFGWVDRLEKKGADK